MIVYQVTVQVDREREDEWFIWMRDIHIGHVLATGFFSRADFERVTGQEGPSASYQIRYYAESMNHYQQYAEKAAAPLQKDHAQRFGTSVSASRLVLEAIG